MGGPPTPHPPLQQLFYFANAVEPLPSKELEHVRLTKLRADGNSTRLETTCCHSILAVDHPAYQGNVVMVPSGACDLDAPSLSPLARIYMHDWDEKADGPPPPLPEGCVQPAADGGKPWRKIMSTPLSQLLDGASPPGEPVGEAGGHTPARHLSRQRCPARRLVAALSRGPHGEAGAAQCHFPRCGDVCSPRRPARTLGMVAQRQAPPALGADLQVSGMRLYDQSAHGGRHAVDGGTGGAGGHGGARLSLPAVARPET